MPPPADKESQKKMIGELLKAADRYIKSADWTKALEEVDKALAIEPNNMYAMAYKDRINVSLTEEKKKAETEKVKKLSEDYNKKPFEKTPEIPIEEKSIELVKAQTPTKEEKPEPSIVETPKAEPKVTASAVKDDAAVRLESLRQEFSATQAKLQREVAQLTMQIKEAQALKEATEKSLNLQIDSLQQELVSAKQSVGKSNDKEVITLKKEIDTLKSKHQKEIDSAKEIAKAEMLTQIAILEKEAEAAEAKKTSGDSELQKRGESIIQMMFHIAWKDGAITPDENALLMILKDAIQMSDQKFNELKTSTKSEAYANALRSIWRDGHVTPDESDFLTLLREKLGVPAEEHFKLERQIRKEEKK